MEMIDQRTRDMLSDLAQTVISDPEWFVIRQCLRALCRDQRAVPEQKEIGGVSKTVYRITPPTTDTNRNYKNSPATQVVAIYRKAKESGISLVEAAKALIITS